MELRPPQYPLSREEFRRALASGHGRAKLHVDRHGVGELRDEVLAAATVCGVYDLQSNGAREDWLADLVLAAGVEREVVAQPVPEDPSDQGQRAVLLEALARRGIQGARAALYSCWNSANGYATNAILELDGDDGLLFVARGLGKRCLEDEEFWLDDGEFWPYDESRSEGAALALLAAHADRDEHIRACLDAIEAQRNRASRRASAPGGPRRSIDEVLEAIHRAGEPQRAIWVPGWGRKATRAELGRVLDLLLELEAPRPLHHALWCLGMSTMPPLHPRIFELTRHADKDVRFWAARCLSKHSLHGVRVCGLDALARGDLVVGLEMLARSTLTEDAQAIVAALRTFEEAHEQHAVCWGLLDILRESPEVTDPRLALYAYDRNPCMQCRERAVRWLCAHQELPDWVAEECSSDAREDIRDLAARPASA